MRESEKQEQFCFPGIRYLAYLPNNNNDDDDDGDIVADESHPW